MLQTLDDLAIEVHDLQKSEGLRAALRMPRGDHAAG